VFVKDATSSSQYIDKVIGANEEELEAKVRQHSAGTENCAALTQDVPANIGKGMVMNAKMS